jgi:predicted NAD/FAD-dependent oxidoreductase
MNVAVVDAGGNLTGLLIAHQLIEDDQEIQVYITQLHICSALFM